jgi:hypothetical protein
MAIVGLMVEGTEKFVCRLLLDPLRRQIYIFR